MTLAPSLDSIKEARTRLEGVIHHTPLRSTRSGPVPEGAELRLKPENLQVTGSFKIRGAYNKIASVYDHFRQAGKPLPGVVTASSGNHGQAVAWASRHFGIAARIVVPETAPQAKIQAISGYGAEVEFCGTTSQARLDRAKLVAEEQGFFFVPPYDDELVMSGQGTIGLEILLEWPDVEMVVVPIGGGGLISGIATAIKAVNPQVQVVGVEAAGAPKAFLSRSEARRVVLEHTETIADGIKTLSLGHLTYPIVTTLVDHLVTVSDEAILDAMRWLLFRHKLLVEPSGAASVAAVLGDSEHLFSNRRIVAVLSGGNLDPSLVRSLL